jgi:hypothetical protein
MASIRGDPKLNWLDMLGDVATTRTAVAGDASGHPRPAAYTCCKIVCGIVLSVPVDERGAVGAARCTPMPKARASESSLGYAPELEDGGRSAPAVD